jgi:ribosome-binding protein aMBF1 (putative translation factor)
MKRNCDICGIEADEHWMHSYNTGRKVMWLCWDCFKKSQYEANKSDLSRQKKLYQIAKSKQRIK